MAPPRQFSLSSDNEAEGAVLEPSVGIAWDDLEASADAGNPVGRNALATNGRAGAPGETRTPNPQIRSLRSGSKEWAEMRV